MSESIKCCGKDMIGVTSKFCTVCGASGVAVSDLSATEYEKRRAAARARRVEVADSSQQLTEQEVATRLQTFGDPTLHLTKLATTTQFVHIF